jgi:tetratricopeptide (TPR) repeat protein
VLARREPPCAGAERAWGSVWDEAQAAEARAAFARSDAPGSARAFATIDAALREYRAGWEAMRVDACEATRVRGEQPQALLDLRNACLDARRREVTALARALAAADRQVVGHALEALASLRSVEGCANGKALTGAPTPPASAGARRQLDALEAADAEGRALFATGRYADGLALATKAVAEARELGHAPLTARLLLVRGLNEESSLRFDDAEATYHDAARTAAEARDDGTQADAWVRLVGLVGVRKERPVEALEWARYAEAAIRRMGGDDQREFRLLEREGMVLWEGAARLEEARALYLRALALAARPGAATPLSATYAETGLAGVLSDMGKPEEALVIARRVRDRVAQILDPGHPDLEETVTNLADALTVVGQHDEAIALYRDVLARGTGSADGYVDHRLAEALRRQGDAVAALAEDRAALEKIGAFYAADAQAFAPALTGEGLDLLLLGRPAEAIAPLERAAAIRAHARLPPAVAETAFALSRALWDGGGDRKRALALAGAAREGYAGVARRYDSALYRREAAEVEAWIGAHRLP